MYRLIIGIGTDLVEIARIRRTLSDSLASRFLQRILTMAERAVANQRASQHTARLEQYVAGRFAAKEAVSKAFGCGIGDILTFQDIQILHDEHSRPQCTVTEKAVKALGLTINFKIHISITHTDHYASAFAVIEEVKDCNE